MNLKRIISGGQTGADEAGLYAGLHLGLDTGGNAPKGWRISLPDGSEGSNPVLKDFGLIEMPTRAYPPRTRKNVEHSDGTVIFGYLKSGGAILTINSCSEQGKPCIKNPTPKELAYWINEHGINCLNVAGNRKSDFNPTIYEDTYNCLVEAVGILRNDD